MYTVLLVEDEDIIRRGIRNFVPWEEYGCTVAGEARNGEEGAALIKELLPDIVITDINMPVVDGLSMLSSTKDEFGYAAIILTGYSDFEYAREAIKSGVAYYVLKPLCMEEMKAALARASMELKNLELSRRAEEKLQKLKDISLIADPGSGEITDPLAARILQFIFDNYEKKITLTDLEDQFHYSERHLNLRFKKAVGTTVIEYLNRYRIQKALKLLKESALPISEIGWHCGIGDYKYFNYVFKKYMGCSPREYQTSVKG